MQDSGNLDGLKVLYPTEHRTLVSLTLVNSALEGQVDDLKAKLASKDKLLDEMASKVDEANARVYEISEAQKSLNEQHQENLDYLSLKNQELYERLNEVEAEKLDRSIEKSVRTWFEDKFKLYLLIALTVHVVLDVAEQVCSFFK